LTRLREMRHVVGYLALFIVLGGTAIALPGKKSIDSNDLKRGVVGTKNIKNHAVTLEKLAGNVIPPAQQQPGASVAGNGELISRSFGAGQIGFLPAPLVLAEIPGFGQVQLLYCGTAPNLQMRVRLLSNDDASTFFFSSEVRSGGVPVGTGQQHNVDTGGGALSAGGGEPLLTPDFTPNGFTLGQEAKWDFQLWRGDGANTTGAHVSVSGVNGSMVGNACQVTAQTFIQK
jgi:hypothetical protein